MDASPSSSATQKKRHRSTAPDGAEATVAEGAAAVPNSGRPHGGNNTPAAVASTAIPPHYFVADDIVWVRPNGYPYWPAEVQSVDRGKNTITCRLFAPPPAMMAAAQVAADDDGGATPAQPGATVTPVLLTTTHKRMFFFDKLMSEEALLAVVEDRLDRKLHDVSAYEFAFVAAVRRANSLVRIVLSPARLVPFSVCGVGVVHSFMRTHVAAPRQPSTKEFAPQSAVIVLKPGLENAVRDLKGFERIWVVFHFSYAVGLKQNDRAGAEASTGFKTMIVPPRDTVQRGVFATRSPHRPNSIGLSCVRLLRVQGLEVHIADHDLLHGTPVLDIKPYLPFCDAHPDAAAGWVQALDARGAGLGDHRGAADASIAVHRNYPTASGEDGADHLTSTTGVDDGARISDVSDKQQQPTHSRATRHA